MQSPQRVALVTGGSRGIGFGICVALAGDGWNLAVNGMRPADEVEQVLHDLRALGADVEYVRSDVSSAADRDAMLAGIRRRFGRLDLVVNNAGITSPGRVDILDATEEAFDRVMDVNFKGAFFLAQAAALWMKEQRAERADFTGCIINISSISAVLASVNRGDYCISWACVSEMTKVLCACFQTEGIQVYEVRPGIIRTDMTKGVTEKYDRLIANGLTIEPRWGEPADIGRAVAMLARGDVTYAPGAAITVDGGLTLLKEIA
ncbi:3-ketoacyl-ACP reductase [Lacipirellula sp.]|uniref:3-ketoacyl-ACP reductase n=1 Tax=Lacipirellula sp. TaxID=2691419 RepID=UPI003D120C2D